VLNRRVLIVIIDHKGFFAQSGTDKSIYFCTVERQRKCTFLLSLISTATRNQGVTTRATIAAIAFKARNRYSPGKTWIVLHSNTKSNRCAQSCRVIEQIRYHVFDATIRVSLAAHINGRWRNIESDDLITVSGQSLCIIPTPQPIMTARSWSLAIGDLGAKKSDKD